MVFASGRDGGGMWSLSHNNSAVEGSKSVLRVTWMSW